MALTTAAPFRNRFAYLGLAAALIVIGTVGGAAAQPADAEPTTVVVKVENGTNRSEGRGDEVRIELLGAVRQEVASGGSFSGETSLTDVPISGGRDYLVTVRYDEVDYYAKAAGSALQRGPQLVYVFDTTTDRAGLTITGMDVIARSQGSTLKLEYIVTVTNESRPQRSVVPAPATLELALPAGASGVEAVDMRGAEAIPAATVVAGRGRTGLIVPFAPGRNSIRVWCLIGMTEPVSLPISANLPVEKWDLLAFPASLQVEGRGLEPDPAATSGDAFVRYLGPPLAENQVFDVTIAGAAAAATDQAAQDIFTQAAPAETEPSEAETSGGAKAKLVVPLAIVLIVAWLVMRRRRGSAEP